MVYQPASQAACLAIRTTFTGDWRFHGNLLQRQIKLWNWFRCCEISRLNAGLAITILHEMLADFNSRYFAPLSPSKHLSYKSSYL